MKINFKITQKLLIIIFMFLLIYFIYTSYHYKNKYQKLQDYMIDNNEITCDFIRTVMEYKNGIPINETGLPFDIVPNIVHYVLFGTTNVTFAHFISILSVLKNQRPEVIYIHCDCHHLTGDYWHRVRRMAYETNTTLIVRYVEKPREVFGQKLSKKYLNWHSSDLTRIGVLSLFGGIYLDTDVYVTQPLNEFLKFEMTLDWDRHKSLEPQTIIAHKNARFLKLWLDSYRFYDPNQWVYNVEHLPTDLILRNRPELIHRVYGKFGPWGPTVCPLLYSSYYEDWNNKFYAFHLYMRGNQITEQHKDWCFRGKVPNVTEFDERIVWSLDVTFGEMVRILLHFEWNFSHPRSY